MTSTRTLGMVALGLAVSASAIHAQDPSRYRNFQLGSDVRAISALAGAGASDVTVLHTRPALMQELRWRRGYAVTDQAALDPVKQILFSFYNDQLTRLVVDYDRDRTAGMTDADMIEAMSATYGPPLKPAVTAPRAVASQLEQESGTRLGRWGDADYSLVLYRSSGASGFRTIVSSPRLEGLARTADAQAIELDRNEAPQRELARQKKETEDAQASKEKARLANKATFRP